MKPLLGATLVGIGLLGHLLSARATGGSALAYRHHVIGFVLILVVTGLVVAAFSWRSWKERLGNTLLTLGAIQAVFGIAVYVLTLHTR